MTPAAAPSRFFRIAPPRMALFALCGLSLGAACIGGAEPTQDETSALVGTGVTATLSAQSDWGTGYCDLVTITNTGAAITGWQVVVTLNSTYSQSWNATAVVTNGQLTAASLSWNGALSTNGTASFGFCGTSTSATSRPALFSVTATRSGGTGAGGSTGAGNTTGTAGATGTGGVAGTGGTTGAGGARGGSTGSGGTSTGGTTGVGGAKGGSTGSGGTSTGGTTGVGGARGGSTGSGGTSTGGAKGGAGSSGTCAAGPLPSGGTPHTGDSQGSAAGLSWSLWENGSGGSMTTFSVPAFSATWGSTSGDFLARTGLEWGSGKAYTSLGTVTAQFAETKSGTAGGYSYIGIYGWSVNPCIEWYIVDDSYNKMPVNPGSTTNKGTVMIDGGMYTLYTRPTTGTGGNRCGNGVTSWNQFYSVRQTARTCGQISISDHFGAWANAGMTLGSVLEASILIEVGGGSGTVDFPTANVTAQ
jgi:endo-1,4-beta-xylanase